MCPIQYVVSGTNLIKPTTLPPTICLFPSAPWLRRAPRFLAVICRSNPPVQWERNRPVSRAVTRSHAGATKASALIES